MFCSVRVMSGEAKGAALARFPWSCRDTKGIKGRENHLHFVAESLEVEPGKSLGGGLNSSADGSLSPFLAEGLTEIWQKGICRNMSSLHANGYYVMPNTT